MNQATKRNSACIIEKEINGLHTFKISGWMDANTSPEIGLKLFGAIEAGSIHIIFEISGIISIIPVVETVDEAMKCFKIHA